MSQRLLIAYDRNTAGLPDDWYDCIYDEFGSLEELVLEWLGYLPGLLSGGWEIDIIDQELYPKFKKDFIQLRHYSPWLQSFEGVAAIRYQRIEDSIMVTHYPNGSTMEKFERLMENDAWKQKKKK